MINNQIIKKRKKEKKSSLKYGVIINVTFMSSLSLLKIDVTFKIIIKWFITNSIIILKVKSIGEKKIKKKCIRW